MIKVNHIDHVAIVVKDLGEATGKLGQMFGLGASTPETVASQKTDVLFLYPGGQEAAAAAAAHSGPPVSAIELCCPVGNESLERFLAKRGPGLHHICFEVDDIVAALAALRSAQVPLIDEVPRTGARGHLVAFIHPKATGGVLFELCQKVQGDHA